MGTLTLQLLVEWSPGPVIDILLPGLFNCKQHMPFSVMFLVSPKLQHNLAKYFKVF